MAALGMIAAAANKIWNAPTAWYWIYHLLRMGAGVILLPLLNSILSEEDMGMQTLFTSLYYLTAVMELVFGPTFMRMIGYAMGGAKELKGLGLAEANLSGQPNYPLVGQVIRNAIHVYRLALIPLLLIMTTYGTWVARAGVGETSDPSRTWMAWGILIVAGVLEFYTGVWALVLRSLNEVLLSARLLAVAYLARFATSVILLLLNFDLLSIPIGTLVGALAQWILIAPRALKLLPREALAGPRGNLFGVIWPTSWRTAIQVLSTYGMATGLAYIVTANYGNAQQAEFGVSYQILGNVIQAMASMWLFVKWPLVSQLRAQRDDARLRFLLRERLWRQALTFIVQFLLLLALGPTVLTWLGIQKNLLPQPLLWLMAAWLFLEMHSGTWTTFLATENRIPSLWPVTIANFISITLAIVLTRGTDWNVGAVIAAPLISGLLFNFWYWPRAGAANIGTTWLKLMFGPRQDLAK